MKCPFCGEGELIPDTRDVPYTYKGETTAIPEVTGEFCPACGEVILTREHGDRYSELIGQVKKQLDQSNTIPFPQPCPAAHDP
ncbi:MAG: type II toxin-antitoxin system MqsA family antitoxin [Azoarcus sp.]|jgi:HTH-type transcriptional regulator/antitoxin MqsA|nr:type II toxin-antitoxin system MqsA family antitoxin [Azoarcus sp.]